MLGLDAYATDWLDLVFRWLHVIAAIVWIGTSFYFIALDNHLLPPKDDRDAQDGVGGEAWEVHGGGFYLVQKYRVAPRTLPEPLHWFKWEAYATWLSGFALLVVLYYVNADTYLIDKSVADLTRWEAIAISVGLLVAAWVVYDGLCRLLGGRELLLAGALLAFVALSAYGAGRLFSGRGSYIQVGAMLGTMMAGNVWVTPVTAALAIAGLAVAIRPQGHAAAKARGPPVAFARVRAIVAERCAVCHSAHPSFSGITSPPKGVAFDTAAEIEAQASRIEAMAVSSNAMPLSNVTKMTQQERDLLGRWIAQGAKAP